MSPREFDQCVAEKGRVRTIPIKGGRYMRICFDKKGKSHAGEVRETKETKEKK